MPKLQLKVLDNLSLDLDKSLSWEKGESNKSSFILNNPGESQIVYLSLVSNIKLISIVSDGPFSVGITKDYITHTITADSLFMYSPDQLDRELLDTLSISPINSVPTSFTVSVYGEK